MVAGASQYRYSAILANTQGRAAIQTNIGDFMGVDMLDVGRSINRNGIGLSPRSRQLARQFMENTSGAFNQLFSVGMTQTSSVEAMQIQINALRATSSERGLARQFQRGGTVDTEA